MTDPGFVYLVQSGEDYRFKIGRTVNLPRRMRSLQLGSPTPLHLVGWQRTPDPVVHEKQWHKNMGISRRHGEWFDLSLKQLRLFREYANAFYRMERQPWPVDMEKPLFLSVGDGHLIEVEVVQIEHTEELWGLILVEAVTTEMGGGEEHAVLFDPHMPRTTFPESSFRFARMKSQTIPEEHCCTTLKNGSSIPLRINSYTNCVNRKWGTVTVNGV